MSIGVKLATFGALALFIVSFFLPATTVVFTEPILGSTIRNQISGFAAARAVLSLPFEDFPKSIWDVIQLLIVWPANLFAAFTFLLLSINGRFTKYAKYLASYAFVGEMYWLSGFHIADFRVGYWVWLISGAFLWCITMFALPHQSQR